MLFLFPVILGNGVSLKKSNIGKCIGRSPFSVFVSSRGARNVRSEWSGIRLGAGSTWRQLVKHSDDHVNALLAELLLEIVWIRDLLSFRAPVAARLAVSAVTWPPIVRQIKLSTHFSDK
jgi:hypothetical protein